MPKFPLGQIVATPGALAAFQEAQDCPGIYLRRHNEGDWGEVSREDRAENELSLKVNRLGTSALVRSGFNLGGRETAEKHPEVICSIIHFSAKLVLRLRRKIVTTPYI